jgi:acyl-CoA thioesterase YciA
MPTSEPYLALKVLMMPRDTNGVPAPELQSNIPNALPLTVFGGVILSYIDQAGAIGARHEVVRAGGKLPFLVTVAVNRVEFHLPVLVGDVVRFVTSLKRIGNTSITMQVTVEAERGDQVLHVTEAEVVYVGIDIRSPDRRPLRLLPGS